MNEFLAAIVGSDLVTNQETGLVESKINGYGIAARVGQLALGVGLGIVLL